MLQPHPNHTPTLDLLVLGRMSNIFQKFRKYVSVHTLFTSTKFRRDSNMLWGIKS